MPNNLDNVFRELGMPEEPHDGKPHRKPFTPVKKKCGKTCFGSEFAAKKWSRKALKRKATDTSRLRSYFCKECKAWHVSSSFFNK